MVSGTSFLDQNLKETNTNNFIELNRRYLIDDMIDSIELCLSYHIDKQTRPKLYNELSEKLCKWGVTKRSIPLIEYCFKLYINDKACFGNFNVKAENLEKAYDIAYTTLASKFSGILPDIDIPYYVEAIKEEGYPRYRVLSYNSEKDEKECFITSDHTEARVKYNELDGESDTISLFIQTSHEAGWSVLKHRLANRVKF